MPLRIDVLVIELSNKFSVIQSRRRASYRVDFKYNRPLSSRRRLDASKTIGCSLFSFKPIQELKGGRAGEPMHYCFRESLFRPEQYVI